MTELQNIFQKGNMKSVNEKLEPGVQFARWAMRLALAQELVETLNRVAKRDRYVASLAKRLESQNLVIVLTRRDDLPRGVSESVVVAKEFVDFLKPLKTKKR